MWFANANVVDVLTGEIYRDKALETAPDGTIAQVTARAPRDAYDIAGRWLLPGLISCHTHLSIVYTQHPYEIAGAVAAVDAASGGRAYLGLSGAPGSMWWASRQCGRWRRCGTRRRSCVCC